MEPIKINEIEETTCKLYNPENKLIGEIKSFLQLGDVRIQIMQNELSGYYIIWKEGTEEAIQIYIDKLGNLDHWPIGFYDDFDNQLDKLLGL